MENIPSLETVAALVTQAARHLHRLFEYAGYVVGFALVGAAGYELYRKARDPHRSPAAALYYWLAGVSLVYINQVFASASLTFLGIDHALMYAPPATDWSTLMMGACIAIIQFLGLLAMLRGAWILQLVGRQELGRLALVRACIFLLFGVLELNILQTARVVFATLGTTSPLD